MTPGDRRQLVWLSTAEPAGLYCADETDPVSDLVCAQLSESLYGYDPTSAATIPSLAKVCDPDADLTVWTCTLRSGVTFHDGSLLDANDVVLSFAVQWDAEHKLHRGHDGTFATFAARFGGFLNAPAPPGGDRRAADLRPAAGRSAGSTGRADAGSRDARERRPASASPPGWGSGGPSPGPVRSIRRRPPRNGRRPRGACP